MARNQGSEIVTVTGIFKRETEQAILLAVEGTKGAQWVPISQFHKDMEYVDPREGTVVIFIPRWLAEAKDFNYDEYDPDERDDDMMREGQDAFNELNFDDDVPF